MEMYGNHHLLGAFFIVEGIDGSGKSIQLSLLRTWLESDDYAVGFSERKLSPPVKE